MLQKARYTCIYIYKSAGLLVYGYIYIQGIYIHIYTYNRYEINRETENYNMKKKKI